ncbi:MAG: universal stress protein [Gemmatimonadetes bacterium]|nr:universal stress protein [Gemmatimonadota bacterium]
MSLLFDSDERRIDFVLHPTDLSQAAERAFHHALALAIRHGAQFTLLHAMGRRATDNWADFPSVRSKLAEWRSAGTTQEFEARIRQASVNKIEVDIRDPVAASMQYIERNSVNMVVLATVGRSGLARLIRPSRAEQLARESRLLTLFVPEGGRTFVNGATGAVTLRRILLPVDSFTDPRPAMLQAVRVAELMDDPAIEITLLHVGEGEETKLTDVPQLPFCKWHVVERSGDVVGQILSMADEIEADAIYMSTAWSKAGFGRVEGGVTERVLAGAPCPVVAVPIDRDATTSG